MARRSETLERTLRDRQASTELKAVAQLLKTALMNERDADIELMSIPAPDMFFMLDEATERRAPGADDDRPFGTAAASRAQSSAARDRAAVWRSTTWPSR